MNATAPTMTPMQLVAEAMNLRIIADRNYDDIPVLNGRYVVNLHAHSTGRHLQISACRVPPGHNTVDKLLVYSVNEWFFTRYAMNERGKVQGFQVDGPWVQELTAWFEALRMDINARNDLRASQAADADAAAKNAEQARLDAFRMALQPATS